jgi:hypothetical protein
MPIREIYRAHELDGAWIIALWRAIHGGDGDPEQVAAQAIAALAQYVSALAQASFSCNERKAQFGKLGVQVTRAHRGGWTCRRKTAFCQVRGRRARIPHSSVLLRIQRRHFLHGAARPYPLANRRLKTRVESYLPGSPA